MGRVKRQMGVQDVAKDLIEQNVNDKWDRVPHLVKGDFDDGYLLYYPNSNGRWNVFYATSVESALEMINKLKG